jgi:type IV secretion system protein VirD4
MIRDLIHDAAIRDLALTALVLILAAALFYQHVISRRAQAQHRVRALRWRTRLRLRPGTGYASLPELALRWSRAAAVLHGRRARPGLGLRRRLTCRTTRYAVRLGRAQYGRRLYARLEDMVLVLAPQRTGKSGLLADRILDHDGPVLAASTRTDLHDTTAAERARLGPVHVFNPQDAGNLPSTLRWDLLGPCRDLVMAHRMAGWLAGAAKNGGSHGNIEWFERKGDTALAGLLFAAAVTGSTVRDVFRWVQLDGHETALRALAEYGTPEMLAVVRRMLADNRTAGSVRDTVELTLAWVAVPGLAEAVTPGPGDSFEVDEFVFRNGTLYMIASGDDDSPLTPLFRALASYVHYEAGMAGTRTRARRLDPPLLMALDEVAVICPVDLPAMLADSAGKGILLMPVTHSVGQLRARWGADGAQTIWATCGTKILLPGISDPETLTSVSDLCGSVVVDGDRADAVVPAEFLRCLPDWRALIVRMNLSPAVVKFRPVWKRPARRFPLTCLPRRPAVPQPVIRPALTVVPDLAGEPAALPDLVGAELAGWPHSTTRTSND